jgi:DNA-binding CsgD family transcriptional regulator
MAVYAKLISEPYQAESSPMEDGSCAQVSSAGISSSAERLVRLLVGRVTAAPPHDPASEVVLLDVDVDGSRYLLVRMPRADPLRIALSPREREIVRMIAQGHCNKVIADILNISTWTVCTHLRRIFAKLGVTSRAAMVARLNETGNSTRL